MMIFFPVGQETSIRRRPVVTLTLLIIMSVIQLYNEMTIRTQRKAYLFSERRYEQVFRNYRRMYSQKYAPKAIEGDYEQTVEILDEFTRTADEKTLEALENGDLIPLDSEEYEQWLIIKAQYAKYKSRFTHLSLGFIPGNPRPWTWITNIFIHANMLHLLGNLIFLWFAGCNMEDRWGRVMYFALFICGGIAANAAHMISHPYSTDPAIGASGAVAALMGAFLIRFPTVPTRVFWLWFGFTFRFGVVTIPAYIGLILWLIVQCFLAFFPVGNVAYWAHLGGFAFGMVLTLLFIFMGFDRRLDNSVERKVEDQMYVTEYEIDPELSQALDLKATGNIGEAVRILSRLVGNNPDNMEFREKLGECLISEGRIGSGASQLAKVMDYQATQGKLSEALDKLTFIDHAGGFNHIPGLVVVRLAESLVKTDRHREAMEILTRLLIRAPGSSGLDQGQRLLSELQAADRQAEA